MKVKINEDIDITLGTNDISAYAREIIFYNAQTTLNIKKGSILDVITVTDNAFKVALQIKKDIYIKFLIRKDLVTIIHD